ncbi:MAG: BMP family ABC transporter substrate-binding protein [Gammaproteobacteria bacterium]|nr:BMP family ABC transporter substrate-binding protein [Gammaproteobacteria bacterium]
MKKTLLTMMIAGAVSMTGAAVADPAIQFDAGGKFDKSFNQSAYEGAERWKAESGGSYAEVELTTEGARAQNVTRLAQRGGDPVVVVGFMNEGPLNEVAPEFPDTNFAIIDMVVDQPNVRSVVFKEHEGSFLVGALAALKSETGTVSFVGGMDIPLIRRFACGFKQGALAVNPDAKVIENMTGTTPAAWNDPAKGGELARAQFEQGSDVVFAAAGGTGTGVYQAAVDEGKYAIGVDSNQNYMHPGTMLTSMVKRVDEAVYGAFKDGTEGNFSYGIQALGLAEGGVDWALDEHNAELVTPAMVKTIERLRTDIIMGEIEVHDYMSDNACNV